MIRALRAAVQTLLFLFIIIRVTPVLAYETETHADISEATATRSGVDQILAESLGMCKGMEEDVSGKNLMFRLRSGSILEDDGARFLNQSSILWGQNMNQCSGPNPDQCVPNWSWQGVRQYFLDALTERRRTDRDDGWQRPSRLSDATFT